MDKRDLSWESVFVILQAALLGEIALREIYQFDPGGFEEDCRGDRRRIASWALAHEMSDAHIERSIRFFLGQALPLPSSPRADLELLGWITAAAPQALQDRLCRISARFLPGSEEPRERAQALACWHRGAARTTRPTRGLPALRQELLRWVRARVVEDVVGVGILLELDLRLNHLRLLSEQEPWVIQQVLVPPFPAGGLARSHLEKRISAARRSRKAA